MNNLKTIFITAILLSINPIFSAQNYTAYTQEEPSSIADAPAVQEETVKKTDLQIWNDHLDTLKVATEQWDAADNVPAGSWTAEAITYAKNALAQDKSIAETLKSAFFDAINTKIDLEKGKFSEKTFALITKFNEAIDAKLKEMEEATAAQEAAKKAVLEEPKPEPVVEQTPAPIETVPAPIAEEITQTQTTSSTTDSSQGLYTQWNNQLYKITTEGTTFGETKNLLSKAYELARQLLSSQISYPENLQFDFEDALAERDFNKRERYPNLSAINFSDAMEAFSDVTGIPMPAYDQHIEQLEREQQQVIAQQQRTAAERQEVVKKEREKELQVIASLQKANIPKSDMQELNRLLQQKLAASEAAAAVEVAKNKAETDAKIEQLREELKIAKTHKAPEAPQGILGTAIGAVKGAASAASRWWYGPNTVEEDQARLAKMREILAVMALTNKEKQKIETDWNTFINGLRTAPQTMNAQWITTIGQALETLITQYHILSLKDARDIIENIIQPSDNRTHIIKEMRRYLKEQEQKNIAEKQQQKADSLKKEQQKKEAKEQKLRAQQNSKDEKNRKEQAQQKHLLATDTYNQEESQWHAFLTQLARNKDATVQDNKTSTADAIKKSQSLLSLAHQIPSKSRPALSQKLKSDFTNALLAQQKNNEPEINVHQNMDQFNDAINKMME